MRIDPKITGAAVGLALIVATTAVAAPPVRDGDPAQPAAPTAPNAPAAVPAPPTPRPMRVVVVRHDGDCTAACPEWISAEGDFVEQTPELFRRVFKAIGDRPLPILIHSRGGSSLAAIEIGRMFRRRHATVVVARTILPGCLDPGSSCDRAKPSEPLLGQPAAPALCLSACVFALAGGETRVAGIETRVGVHQASVAEQLIRRWQIRYRVGSDGEKVEVGRDLVDERREKVTPKALGPGDPFYDRVAGYFRGVGVSEKLVALAASTPVAEIRLLTRAELQETKLTTTDGGVDGVLRDARVVHMIRPAVVPSAGPPDVYRAVVPMSLVAAAKLQFPGGAPATLHFETLYQAPTVGWRLTFDRAAVPAEAVFVGFRIATAERVVGGRMPLGTAVGDETTRAGPSGQLTVADFCGIAASPMTVFQMFVRPTPKAPSTEWSVTTGRLAELDRLRAFLCPSPVAAPAAAPTSAPVQPTNEKPRKASTTRS